MKVKLSPEQKAQILAGSDDLEIESPGAVVAAKAEVEPKDGEKTEPKVEAKAEPKVEAKADVTPSAEVLAFLRSQLSEKDAALLSANVEIASLKAAAAGAAESMPKLLEIVQGVVGNMQIALGASDSAKVMGAKDLVAEHARVQPVYAEKFKVGGLAVRTTETEGEPQVHPAFQQRLAAVAKTK